ACGSNDNQAKTAEDSTSTSGTKQVTLKFFTYDPKAMNEPIIKKFEEKYPNIKIDLNVVAENNSSEYIKKMDLQLMSGEQMDIVLQQSPGEHVIRAKNDLLAPLDDYFAKEGKKFTDVYTSGVQVNGKYYGVPIDLKSWFVIINKKLLDEAGLPVPSLDWTWDDYRVYAKAMTKGEGQNKVYGSYMQSGTGTAWANYYVMPFYSTKESNATYFKEDGSHDLLNPALKDWLQFRFDLESVDQSQTPSVDILSSNLAYRNQFFNGKAAMMPIGSWMIGEIKDTDKFPHDFVTTFAPLPKFEGGTAGRTFSEATYLTISKTSQYKEEAYEFLRFYSTEGMKIKGFGFSAEKESDKNAILDLMIGTNQNMYDMDALKKVLDNPAWEDNLTTDVPIYNNEVTSIVSEEAQKYLVGGQTIDKTIENMSKRSDEIITRSKK
ncbi:MAG: sugar ABC transporter substrate-binding protein, partial [Gorillibacterium sp.]|nr:sugar ABC transporter substrate-binding protein [Gorillibacterium sp.]